MSLLNEKDTVIMIIDIQEKLLNAVFNKEIVEKSSAIISKTSNILNIPTIITEQYPKGLGNTIDKIKENINNSSSIFEKNTFSALENIEVKNALENTGKKQVILLGIETHICVSQTAAALVDADYEVHVISDACGSRTESEYEAGLNRIKSNGGHIITTEIALFELLKGAKHPHFKEIQSLIK